MDGTELKKLRKELGLTQTELADIVDVDRKTIYKYERSGVPKNKVKAFEALLKTWNNPHDVVDENVIGGESNNELVNQMRERIKNLEELLNFYKQKNKDLEKELEKYR